MKMNKKVIKEVKEWTLLILVGSVLYFTGWYAEIGAFLQRGILELGLMKPEQIEVTERNLISYDFELVDVHGQTIDFNDFKNKTVLINFWATWCPPCKAEMPDLENLYQKTNSKIDFVMVARDDNFQKAIDYVNDKNFSFPIYQMRSRTPKELVSNSIPSTFVISPQGEIAAKRVGMAKFDTEEFKEFLISL